MSTKGKIILVLLSFLTSMSVFAEGVRFLVVNVKDGTKTTFGLAEEPKISFANGELSIVGSSRTFSIRLADVLNYSFSEESTGVEEVMKDGGVKIENGFVVFKGLTSGSIVAAYMQDGKLVMENKADSNGSAVIDLSGLPKTILILQSNKTSIKVINR